MLALLAVACVERTVMPYGVPDATTPPPLPPLDASVEYVVPDDASHPLCARLDTALREVDEHWTGDPSTCDPGEMSEALQARGLPTLDLARELAGLPPLDAAPGAAAQACAMAMHANDRISHHPDRSWACVDDDTGRTAAMALLANVPLDTSMRAFLVDPGNDDTLGHRRWLLSSWLAGLELGSTDRFSCVELLVDGLGTSPPWVAWPPPGAIPRSLLEIYGYTVDEVGWSIQSDSIDLSTASVDIVIDGEAHPVEVYPLEPLLGSLSAIRFTTDTLPHSRHYRVVVRDVAEPFAYDVELLDCVGAGGVW